MKVPTIRIPDKVAVESEPSRLQKTLDCYKAQIRNLERRIRKLEGRKV